MAKTNTSYDKFLADVLKAVPADKRDLIQETLSAEDVRKVGEPRVLARDEFSRAMDDGRDELKAAREALDGEITEARSKINGWSDWYKTASTEFATAKDKLDRYETEYGPLDGQAGKGVKKFLTAEELEANLAKTLGDRDAFAIDTAVLLSDLGDDYREKFGTRINRKELIDYATKHALRLDVAYDRFIAPKLQEKQKADFEKALETARNEGAQSERSKHHLPSLSGPTEVYTPSYQKGEQNLISRNAGERVGAAVDDFNALVSSAGR